MKRRILRKRTAFAAALLMAALFALNTALGADETLFRAVAHIPVRETFSTNVPDVGDTFTYVLEAQTPGAPTPNGRPVYAFTMEGNELEDIAIEMQQPGTYVYSLHQTVKNPQPHYFYDRTVYEVTVCAYQDANGLPAVSVVMHGKDDGKVSVAVFQNRYIDDHPGPAPEDGGSVQTGDENHLLGYILMMIGCALGLCLLWVWVKKTDKA